MYGSRVLFVVHVEGVLTYYHGLRFLPGATELLRLIPDGQFVGVVERPARARMLRATRACMLLPVQATRATTLRLLASRIRQVFTSMPGRWDRVVYLDDWGVSPQFVAELDWGAPCTIHS